MAKPKSRPQLGLDAAHVADDAAGLPDGHWSRLFFEHVYCSFDDAQFTRLYEDGGRYPVSPSLLACITILQYAHKVSDRVAVDNTVMRRDWRVALGRDSRWEGFDPSVLCNFRKRLIAHGMERELFDAVLGRLRELGLMSKRRRLRVDATHLVADVAVLSLADALREAIRIVVCDLHQLKPTLERRPDFARLLNMYGEETWLGKGSDGELTPLAVDGQALLEICGGWPARGKEVLAQMLRENFIFPEDAPPKPLERDQRPDDRILTPHEPDVRAGKKGDHIWTGDKVHFVETADDDQPNFIVDVMSTDPRLNDTQVLEDLAQRARSIVPGAEQLLADGGYASAHNTRRAAEAGIDLICPARGSTSGCNGMFPSSQFRIDLERRIVTCPAGNDSTYWRLNPREITIRFRAATCAACPFRAQCTRSPRGRSLGISRDYAQLLLDRARAQTDEFKDLYKKRAPIESTISHLVRDCGLRRSRYRSRPKRALHAIFAATALNVRRLLHWLATDEAQQGPNSRVFSHRSMRLTGTAWRLVTAISRPISNAAVNPTPAATAII